MKRINVKVLLRPYFHDLVEVIERTPKTRNGIRYVTYNKREYVLKQTATDGYYIWIDD